LFPCYALVLFPLEEEKEKVWTVEEKQMRLSLTFLVKKAKAKAKVDLKPALFDSRVGELALEIVKTKGKEMESEVQ
jgi:hypothetical protein